MNTFAAEQLPMLAGDQPAATDQTARRCVRFGCAEAAVWIVNDPQGGVPPACEADLEGILIDAVARVPLYSRARVEVWRA